MSEATRADTVKQLGQLLRYIYGWSWPHIKRHIRDLRIAHEAEVEPTDAHEGFPVVRKIDLIASIYRLAPGLLTPLALADFYQVPLDVAWSGIEKGGCASEEKFWSARKLALLGSLKDEDIFEQGPGHQLGYVEAVAARLFALIDARTELNAEQLRDAGFMKGSIGRLRALLDLELPWLTEPISLVTLRRLDRSTMPSKHRKSRATVEIRSRQEAVLHHLMARWPNAFLPKDIGRVLRVGERRIRRVAEGLGHCWPVLLFNVAAAQRERLHTAMERVTITVKDSILFGDQLFELHSMVKRGLNLKEIVAQNIYEGLTEEDLRVSLKNPNAPFLHERGSLHEVGRRAKRDGYSFSTMACIVQALKREPRRFTVSDGARVMGLPPDTLYNRLKPYKIRQESSLTYTIQATSYQPRDFRAPTSAVQLMHLRVCMANRSHPGIEELDLPGYDETESAREVYPNIDPLTVLKWNKEANFPFSRRRRGKSGTAATLTGPPGLLLDSYLQEHKYEGPLPGIVATAQIARRTLIHHIKGLNLDYERWSKVSEQPYFAAVVQRKIIYAKLEALVKRRRVALEGSLSDDALICEKCGSLRKRAYCRFCISLKHMLRTLERLKEEMKSVK